MKCPFCGFENLAGVDECDQCGEDLTSFEGLHLRDKLEKSLVKDPVSCFTTNPPIIMGPQTPIQQVIEKLASENRCVLVMDGTKLIGIVTERDVLFKVAGTDKDLKTTPVSEIMTPNPETLLPTDKIAYALNKMAIGGFRHIPLMVEGKPQGVISVRDVISYLGEMFPDVKETHQ